MWDSLNIQDCILQTYFVKPNIVSYFGSFGNSEIQIVKFKKSLPTFTFYIHFLNLVLVVLHIYICVCIQLKINGIFL